MKLEISFDVSVTIFEKLREKDDPGFIRRVGNKFLTLGSDSGFEVKDYEDLPEDEQEKRRFSHRKESLSRNPSLRSSREVSYEGQSPDKIANRAADNPYILSDVLDDPGLVEAEGETEAVAKVAEQNPGWAKMSDAVEAHGLDVDADGNVSTSGDASSGDTGAAEAASEAASYSGDVSTADAGDLGPTGPSGYGIDTGAGSGSGGGGDSGGSGLGGDAGGGDL